MTTPLALMKIGKPAGTSPPIERTRMGTIETDVVVIGGGPAGSVTALELSREGYSVAIIERSNYKNIRVGETLPPSIRRLLTDLGLWDRFIAQNHSASVGICSVWGQPDLRENDFIVNPYGLGWHVDRSRFDRMLVQAAEDKGAVLYQGTRLTSLEKDAKERWKVEINQEARSKKVHARFLVDASGRASMASRRQGAEKKSWDRLVGMVSFFLPSTRNEIGSTHTLVEAVEDGWWYSAVLPDLRMIVAYMTDADLCPNVSKTPAFFLSQLKQALHTQSRIKFCYLRAGPRVYAANSCRLNTITSGSWLATGEAAVAFDPLSAQGIVKAIESGIHAAHAIRDYWSNDPHALNRYAAAIGEDFISYLRMRHAYYSRETRWSGSTFWTRRHNTPSLRAN
jgi:flavin-dependent dehydrogenase